MHRLRVSAVWSGLALAMMLVACSRQAPVVSSHPASDFILGMEFDLESVVTAAPGSDNWAITWARDGHQYTTWGDGGGFGGNNQRGRVSMGVARIEGPIDNMHAVNVWGGYQALAEAQFAGKSYGILALDDTLWMWRTGDGSDDSAFSSQELFFSEDKGLSWQAAGVRFDAGDFRDSSAFFAPTFLQFGAGYRGSRDEYVYMYAPDNTLDVWDVQVPGEISLMRVPREAIGSRARYEFFAGFDAQNQPLWSPDPDRRQGVFVDVNGVMRTSVSYNAGLGRFLLITQQISRFRERGYIGIYESVNPWGPWRTVLFASPWRLGLQTGEKSVYWNFSNKWNSADGKRFALVYTGPGADNFGVVQGRFILAD